MKATDLLKGQHRDVEKLFRTIENAEGKDKMSAFQELAASLVGHDAIEREIFYPACEKKMGMTDLLGESLVEHGVVEFCLYEADQARAKKSFDYKVQVLKEIIEHHVEEEEKEFFPKVEKALGTEMLEDLGVRMQMRFEQAMRSDFREPLHQNLRQVLAGAIKTTPSAAKKTALRRNKAKRTVKRATTKTRAAGRASH